VPSKEKIRILTGSIILITLGVLILLNNLNLFGFNRSWPFLLLAIGAGTMIQNWRDKTGWFIALVGLIFVIKENFYGKLAEFTNYVAPLLLILIGAFVLIRGGKK
jgi:hypothetical protein